ncbi:MAG: hypothetical protein COA44_15835 [Arcobacter sp.]|nr:MAG: hypothetical protein COA44_15835 [Arcobacter sp.]
MLTRVGSIMGDKSYKGTLPNLKYGEFRYYPHDNKNLTYAGRELTCKVFRRILKRNFPQYALDTDVYQGVEELGTIGLYTKGDLYQPIVINKGYICFKEATELEDGTVFYLHDGAIIVYKEKGIPCT